MIFFGLEVDYNSLLISITKKIVGNFKFKLAESILNFSSVIFYYKKTSLKIQGGFSKKLMDSQIRGNNTQLPDYFFPSILSFKA
jgi:hypothetical protein